MGPEAAAAVESNTGAVGARSARYDSRARIIFSIPAMLFSKPPEIWSPRGWECEWYSSIAWCNWGMSRLTSATISSRLAQPLLSFADGLFLVGVGYGVAPLL